MTKAAKIAVSLPASTLRSLDRIRRRLGSTRSAAVTRAIDDWVRLQEVGADDKRYAEGYLRVPEREAETASIAAGATAAWDPWP